MSDIREQRLREFFDAVNKRDFARIKALFALDAVFEVPYEGAVYRGNDGIADMFENVACAMWNPFQFTIESVIPGADSETVVVAYRSQGRTVETGIPYSNRYLSIVRMRDGSITLFREYFDPRRFEHAVGRRDYGELMTRVPFGTNDAV